MSNPLEKEFVVYGDSGIQMFSWLSPYIEDAGYKYTITEVKDNYGNMIIGARKITITLATT